MPWSREKPFSGVKNESAGLQNTFYKSANAILLEGGAKDKAIQAGWTGVKKKYKKRGGKWVPKLLSQAIIERKRTQGQPLASSVDLTALPKEAFILNRATKKGNWRYPYQYLTGKGVLVIHAELLEKSYRQALNENASSSTLKRIQRFRREMGMVETRPSQGEKMLVQKTRTNGAMALALRKALKDKKHIIEGLIAKAQARSTKCGIGIKAKGNCLSPPKDISSESWADPVNFVGFVGNKKSLSETERAFRRGKLEVKYESDEKKAIWNRIISAKKAANISHVYDPISNPMDRLLEGDAEKYAKSCEEFIEVNEEFEVVMPFVTNEEGGIKVFEKKGKDGSKRLIIKGEATNTMVDKDDERVTKTFLKKIKQIAKSRRLPAFLEHQRDVEHTLGFIDSEEVEEVKEADGVTRLFVGIDAEDPKDNKHVDQILKKAKHGTPLGLSIGGLLVRVKRTYDAELDRAVTDLGDGDIWEMSVTAMPSINDSRSLVAFAKSVSKTGKNVIRTKVAMREVLEELMEALDLTDQLKSFWAETIQKATDIKTRNVSSQQKKSELIGLLDEVQDELQKVFSALAKGFVDRFELKLQKERG